MAPRVDEQKQHESTIFFVKKAETALGSPKAWVQSSSYSGGWLGSERHGYGVETSKTRRFEGSFVHNQREGPGDMYVVQLDAHGDDEAAGELQKTAEEVIQSQMNALHSAMLTTTESASTELMKQVSSKTVTKSKRRTPAISKLQPESFTLQYRGEWKADRYHGSGELHFADGAVYRGEFFQGQRQGEGSQEYPDGTEYHGQWLVGRRHGFGRLLCPIESTLSLFEGEFCHGRRDGYGLHFDGRHQRVSVGLWCDGKLVATLSQRISVFSPHFLPQLLLFRHL